ncbi:hypothetical protein AVEN_225987-1 [Araneus ventricosus]|uniref:Uncharacterized protein n=1 Tax=Araneus ventricosus TaxID=182803 RepID=A0A4Y2TQ64_ARAVE|nr:hypothetical protein AVEN_225987-1 [Araneus ventricosus]
MALKAGIDGCQIIEDTYINDIVSLQISLIFIQQQQPPTKRTVISSDMLQSTTPDNHIYQELAALLAKYTIHRFIGNICMNMAMVDATGIQPKPSDGMIIFSAEHSIDALVERLDQRLEMKMVIGEVDVIATKKKRERKQMEDKRIKRKMVKTDAAHAQSMELLELNTMSSSLYADTDVITLEYQS